MFETALYFALFLIAISIALCLYRIIRGPSNPDRVMALDTITFYLIAAIAIVSLLLKSSAFLGAILLLGILSFIGTIALSKYIERGFLIEHDDDR